MKYKTTNNLNLRSEPSINGKILKLIPKDTIIESDENNWKAVTLPDGTSGFCSADYLERVETDRSIQVGTWNYPLPKDYFIPSQTYLNEDWKLYPKFGYHTGVDYGGHGRSDVPIFACTNGEIVYREVATSDWGKYLGNHVAIYVPSVNKSFLYCHLKDQPPQLGNVTCGDQIGIMGNTGKSSGGAIHLHLEGFHGRFSISLRTFTSRDDIKIKTFDADEFIRSNIVTNPKI